jgi:acyl-CoA synthetase (AMP-forming)/AMP-acid ligase II
MSETVNVAAALVKRARERPDVVALFASRVWDDFLSSHDGPQQTFRQLNDDSDRLARGLMKMGITRGMRTVLMVPPSRDLYALTFALFKVGAVVVLIDPGMGVKNLGICIAEAEPEAFVGVRKAHLARIILGWGKKTIRHRVTVGPRLFWGGWSLSRVRREGERGDPVLATTTADETAAILFTSGSTGVAKGAVYTHGIFAAQLGYLKSLYGIEPGEVDLPTFPLFGLFGPALGMSASIPYMDFTRPGLATPQFIAGDVRSAKVTNLFGSPALLRRVFFDKQTKPDDFKTLRRVLSAGAPVSAEVIRKVVELLPPGVQVHTPYGATEALPVATIGSDEILGETAALTAKGMGVCVGRPVPGMDARIIRVSDEPIPTWSDDLVVPQGEIGEVAVRGPVVTKAYYNRPDSTALHKIHDGNDTWHRMGDLGYLDALGRLWFCGRKSQRVITKLGTFYTMCTEGVFNAHPLVFRTALVGVDRGNGVEPELCVEIDPELPRAQRPDRDGASRQRFLRELAELGTQSSHSSAVRRFHLHRAFPVDVRHNAKIFREKLAVWAAKQSGGQVT